MFDDGNSLKAILIVDVDESLELIGNICVPLHEIKEDGINIKFGQVKDVRESIAVRPLCSKYSQVLDTNVDTEVAMKRPHQIGKPTQGRHLSQSLSLDYLPQG